MNDTKSPQKFTLPCRHLRSKEMFYQEPGQEEDEFSSHTYWCLKTHEGFGPDGKPVGKTECCAGRPCYVD